jgi:hypothetical protein
LRPKVDNRTAYTSTMREEPAEKEKPRAVAKSATVAAPSESVDPNSTAEAAHVWHRAEKDAIIRRVESLSPSEAENLCFRLNLIPRDEVFDKVNVKSRLKRYIDGLHTDAEMADVEAGFRDLADHR